MIKEVRNKIEVTSSACLTLSDIVNMFYVYGLAANAFKKELKETLDLILAHRGENDDEGVLLDKKWKSLRGVTTEESTVDELTFLLGLLEPLDKCCNFIDEYMKTRDEYAIRKLINSFAESLSGQN